MPPKQPAKKGSNATSGKTTARAKAAPAQVPIVDYLRLGARPYLRANECAKCGARFFDRRNACASCGGTEFRNARVKNTGRIKAFTIVRRAMPGVPVPYVSGIIETDDGTTVRGNVVGVDADTFGFEQLGRKVKLTTWVGGTDDEGTEAVVYGYQLV